MKYFVVGVAYNNANLPNTFSTATLQVKAPAFPTHEELMQRVTDALEEYHPRSVTILSVCEISKYDFLHFFSSI